MFGNFDGIENGGFHHLSAQCIMDDSGYDLKIVCLSTCTMNKTFENIVPLLCKLGDDIQTICQRKHGCTVLTSRKNGEKAVHSCIKLSVWSLSCHCCVTFSTQLSALAAYSTFYFWLIRSPADPVYTSSIFVHSPLDSRFHFFRRHAFPRLLLSQHVFALS